MNFINKIKGNTSSVVVDKSLDKYLPKTLFLGIQKDISEKALKGYILALAKTAFENIGDVKYSIKKIKKDEFLYELHNGSLDLSYLQLVHNELFVEKSEGELILKTENNNVRVTRKPSGKIETNILLEHNSRENEAQFDKDFKGRMTPIVKDGLGLFVTGALFLVITGALASVSFVTKYTMMNEDYSFSYEKDMSLSPMQFIESLKFNDHSAHKYVKSIKFSNGKWKEEYGLVEKKKIDNNAPKKEDIKEIKEMDDDSNSNNYRNKEVVVEIQPVITMEEVVEIKPVITMEEVVTLKPVVTMEEVVVSKVSKDDEIEIIDIEDISEISIPEVKGNRNFEIIDMETLDNLDLSNLPENIVIEEGK